MIQHQAGHPEPWHLYRNDHRTSLEHWIAPGQVIALLFREKAVAERAEKSTLAEALSLRWAQFQLVNPFDILDNLAQVPVGQRKMLLMYKATSGQPRTPSEEAVSFLSP